MLAYRMLEVDSDMEVDVGIPDVDAASEQSGLDEVSRAEGEGSGLPGHWRGVGLGLG